MKVSCMKYLLPHKMGDAFTPSLHPFPRHEVCNGMSPALQ